MNLVARPGLQNVLADQAEDDGELTGKASLEPILALVESDLKQVNALIVRHVDSPVPLIPQLASHIVSAGGKRLRPILTLAAAKLCGYTGERHLLLAATVEFIHTATLLHDDVVDSSDLRRGLATANAVWGNKPSVLVGDFLFSRAFQLMVSDGSLDVLRVLSEASAVIAEGEVLQLITANDIETDESAYLRVIASKTAALFAAAAEVGAMVGERPVEEIDALRRYGHNLGMAFQLIDDVLDYSAREAEMGKSVGDDFRDGKMTLPIVLALRSSTDIEREFWRRTLEDQEQRDGDLEHAIALLHRHGTLAATRERAEGFGRAARDALSIFPDSPARHALLEVVRFCMQRGY
jgi:octaprenyl-diphosphate synthase